jgi:hypothetical protein
VRKLAECNGGGFRIPELFGRDSTEEWCKTLAVMVRLEAIPKRNGCCRWLPFCECAQRSVNHSGKEGECGGMQFGRSQLARRGIGNGSHERGKSTLCFGFTLQICSNVTQMNRNTSEKPSTFQMRHQRIPCQLCFGGFRRGISSTITNQSDHIVCDSQQMNALNTSITK